MALLEPCVVALRTGDACAIRSAEESDAEPLLAATRSVVEDAPWNITTPAEFTLTVDDERAWIVRHREQPGWIALVAVVGGTIVGLVHLENSLRQRLAHRGNVGLSVVAAWRGRGVGDALMTTLMTWAAENPLLEKVCLGVVEDNVPAVALYRKHGFVEEARRPREIRYAPDRYSADLLMYRFVK
jgi:RimJ/RimL family protein N-acetyltransferase